MSRFWITRGLRQLIYKHIYCVKNIRHQHPRTLCVVHTTSSMDVLMTCCCNAVPSVYQVLSQFIVPTDMTSGDVIGTQKRQLSSSKSIKQKYLLVYHSETKLSFAVSIILAHINE